MRKVVLLRVGVDAGCGGIQGPLFKDRTFEFICIPDGRRVGETYHPGNYDNHTIKSVEITIYGDKSLFGVRLIVAGVIRQEGREVREAVG